jgi:hypothetical protein
MKEIYKVLQEAYEDNPKEFWGGIGTLCIIVLFSWFMFWFFIPNFAYDM